MNIKQQIWQKILESKSPILCIDSRFDYDAFGSALALKNILQKNHGIGLRLTYTDWVPQYAVDLGLLEFESVEQNLEPKKIDFSKHDLFITTDSATYVHISKSGEFAKPENIFTIKVDHHTESEGGADLEYLKEASSACRLWWEILTENGEEIDKDTAYFLALGILTDSGFLQYSSVDSEDYRIIADAVDKGVDIPKISWTFSYNQKLDELKFAGLIYDNLVVDYDKKYAYSSYDFNQLSERGIDTSKTGLKAVDLIKRLRGIDFAFVVKKDDPTQKRFDVSFRSHLLDYDVSKFAIALGGGGHKMAASGFMEAENLEEAISNVKKFLEDQKA